MKLKFSAPKFFTAKGIEPESLHALRKHFGGMFSQRWIEFGVGARFLPES
jgi:hypothetical protein